MKKVAIYGQSYAVNAENEVTILLAVLAKNNIVVFIEKDFYTLLREAKTIKKKYPTFSSFEDLNASFELLFTLGGDGTILRSVTYIRDLNIPVLGINTGRLGFLATIKKDEIEPSVALLLKGKYSIQERSLLHVKTSIKNDTIEEFPYALNEITISRRNTTSMIGVKTFLNDEYLTNYWADGLIIATPTGSTGYSLSCNGPVILPNSKSLAITPIAPHNLNARSVILPDETTIKLNVNSREKKFLISMDSRIATVSENTEVILAKAEFSIKTILLDNHSFLQTLRSKLLWGEDTRNQTTL